MLRVRRAGERGHAGHGWLDTYHTFSFGDYHDPKNMGFRALRVINEDVVAPAMGFGMHGHRDMEIVTYVLEGALQHKDSMGNGETLRPGEFQRMSAGTGVRHSEFNASQTEPVHLYQIWLLPAKAGIQPSYEQKFFANDEKQNRFRVVASPDAAEGSLKIHQDASILLALVDAGKTVEYPLLAGRHAWLQVLRGSVTVNGTALQTSDAVAVSEEAKVTIVGDTTAEVMLFDLA
ncbi:MAG: pirin family protein [Gemmataceae bacterium]|nr:pirin family protein [Gemmataceae bacterium]